MRADINHEHPLFAHTDTVSKTTIRILPKQRRFELGIGHV
jgi:hypothetical protein